MSAQLSPPPASISAAWTSTLPRSCSGRRSPRAGSEQRAHHRVPTGRQRPQERAARHGPPPVPPGSTTTRRVLVPFTSEVPFWSGGLLFRHPQFPLTGGHFRGCAPVSSCGSVNDRS